MLHFVQLKVQGVPGNSGIQRHRKEAEEWEDKEKKNREAVMNIVKKREQYEGES